MKDPAKAVLTRLIVQCILVAVALGCIAALGEWMQNHVDIVRDRRSLWLAARYVTNFAIGFCAAFLLLALATAHQRSRIGKP